MKVLLVLAKGLHLGYLGCYGNEWVQTPALDRLAAEGIVCDLHFVDRVNPIWDGGAWGASVHRTNPTEPPETLVGCLNNRGVKTCLITRHEVPAAAGWDYISVRQEAAGTSSTRKAPEFQSIIDKLAGASDWYVQVEVDSLLPPWPETPSREDSDPEGAISKIEDRRSKIVQLQDCYAAAVSCLDGEVQKIRSVLDDAGLLDQVCWIVTTDRGQPVDEDRPEVPPPPWLHEEWIHIPLIIRLPGQAQAGRRVGALTQSRDLFSTILDMQGATAALDDGRSLLPLLEGRESSLRECVLAVSTVGDVSSWAVRTVDSSILLRLGAEPFDPGRDARVYIKPEDRWEVNNVCQHHLDLVDEMRQFVQRKAL